MSASGNSRTQVRNRAAGMLSSVAVLLVVGTLCGCLAACSMKTDRSDLSVIVVTLDTTRADRLGAYGGSRVPTPNLDRIAREGVVIENAVSQVPLTLPAHATIFTGRYPASHGVRHNGLYRLRDEETTLAERLRDSGFETAAVVGAFVLNRGLGIEQGFNAYDDIPGTRIEMGQDRMFEAQRTADDVNAVVFEWLDGRPKDRRFFLWVHYYDPHDPYEPPEKPGRRLSGSGYEREISYVDACFGDLVQRLEREDLLDSSLLVVVGDHGESLGDHDEMTHGLLLYEGTLRVPMFLRAPGLLPANTRVKGLAELVDLAPTILDLLGLPPLDTAQGESLVSRIKGEDDGRGAVAYAETLMPRIEYSWSELRTVEDGRFKYIQAPKPELYDLREDPGERVNLVSSDPERSAEMAAMLAEWQAATERAAGGDARRTLTADEEARLRSLGYLEGEAFKQGDEDGREGEVARPDPKDHMRDRERVFAARARLTDGDAAGALVMLDAILEDNPGNYLARNMRVSALIALKRWAEAEEQALAFIAAAESDPGVSSVHLEKARGLLASVYRFQGRKLEAEEQYRLILKTNPVTDIALADLARILVETGRRDEARRLLDDALERNPGSRMALAERYLLEEEDGDAEAAGRMAAALADVGAGDPQVLRRAGRRLLDSDDPNRAAACFQRALDQTGPDLTLLGELGTAEIRAGRPRDARKTFLEAARLWPTDARPQYYLGRIALQLGDEEEGRSRLDRALRLDPDSSLPLTTLGTWLASQGRRREARETLERALRIDPTDAKARKALEKL